MVTNSGAVKSASNIKMSLVIYEITKLRKEEITRNVLYFGQLHLRKNCYYYSKYDS